MTARVLVFLLSLPVAGVLVGSGLAALAHAPGNDPCLNLAGRTEGRSWWDGSLELWPLGLRCENSVRSEFFGPTTAELYAWIAAAALLAAVALLRRDSALVRGAAGAALLLALAGVSWLYFGGQFAVSASVVFSVPVAFVIDHRLRPPGARSRSGSLSAAIALGVVTFCAMFGMIFIPVVGIAFGLIAGAIASAALERARATRLLTT